MVERVVFTGDCAMNSHFFNDDPVSKSLVEYIRGASLSVANFEAAIDCSPPVPKTGPNIAASEKLIGTLNCLEIDAVSVANNHTMDFGVDGLKATIQECHDNNFTPFGAGERLDQALDSVEYSVGDTTVGIFGLSEHEIGIAGRYEPGVGWIRSPEVLTQLQSRAQEFDVSIVVAHGGVEYVPLPPPSWRSLLRTIATLDVDLVVGHHPHNVQGNERYGGTPIHYSLGNFLMYNDYFEGAQWGCLLDIKIDDGKIVDTSKVLTSATDGTVTRLDSPDPYRSYLDRSSEIVHDDERYNKYWQAIAEQLYDQRYHQLFVDYGQGPIGTFLRQPLFALDRFTRRIAGEDVRHESWLGVLDHVANQSHRDVIRTSLDLSVGRVEQKYDEAIEEDLKELFLLVDARDERSGREVWTDRFQTLVDRLISSE